jgi:NADH-quinone oxidoreductase subunit L
MTHAFFKGLLFLGAGSVMHALSGELDMRKMGGLRTKIPITFWTFFFACLAIAGIFPFSGFFSKDEILWQALTSSHGHWLLWLVAAIAAGMTAFYMFRAVFMTFWGECRAEEQVKHHIHESPRIMTVPLLVLMVLSIVGGWIGIPHALGGPFGIENYFHEFLAPVVGGGGEPGKAHAGLTLLSQAWASSGEPGGHSAAFEILMMVVSLVIALSGIGIAYHFYVKNPALPKLAAERWKRLYKLVYNKYYVDEIYQVLFVNFFKSAGMALWKGFDEFVIDGTINGIAYLIGLLSGAMRKIQTGVVQNYAFSMIIGGIVLVAYYVVRAIFY